MVGGEDYLSAESTSSAFVSDAALSPKDISGSGVAFFLGTFSWLSKKKYLASRAKSNGFNCVQIKTLYTLLVVISYLL